jgi:hypothetical protein
VHKPQLLLAALAIGASSLAGCAPARSSLACPPVVAYPPTVLAAAAAELELLPAGSAIERLLADYSVMRDQARACAP